MIDKLRGAYEGAKIAVLGSAPSVRRFLREEDVVIGINGAASLLKEGDFFFSNDEIINMRSYFKEMSPLVTCVIRPHAAIYSYRMYPDEELRRKFVERYESFIRRILEEDPVEYGRIIRDESIAEKVIGGTVALKEGGPWVVLPSDYAPRAKEIDELFEEGSLPGPISPHLVMRSVFQYLPDTEISRNQKHLYYMGTSSSAAIQLAYIMGASEIHLYGVEFSNKTEDGRATGTNYFYKAKKGEAGITTDSQRKVMDEVVRKIIDGGIRILSHGPTNLENTIRLP